MKTIKIIAILLTLSLISCYKEVPFKGLEHEPKLFFQCMPGVQDTTVFWLRSTFPVNHGTDMTPLTDPRMYLKVNGEDVELQQNNGISTSFPSDAFFTTKSLAPGDRLDFKAEATGFESISSSTVIPSDFKDLTVEARWIPSPDPDYYTAHLGHGASQGITSEIVEFKLTFQDEPGIRNCYMAEVIQYIYHKTAGQLTYYSSSVSYVLPKEAVDSPLTPERNTDMLLVEHNAPWNTINDYHGNGRLSCVFNDDGFDGEKHVMEILVNNGTFSTDNETKYRLRLYHVGEEYYKYAKAWKVAEDAEYGSELPSSTPFMAYDNIDGGSGIFAGAVVYDTGLITPTPMN